MCALRHDFESMLSQNKQVTRSTHVLDWLGVPRLCLDVLPLLGSVLVSLRHLLDGVTMLAQKEAKNQPAGLLPYCKHE